jgi:hypothetical protein
MNVPVYIIARRPDAASIKGVVDLLGFSNEKTLPVLK